MGGGELAKDAIRIMTTAGLSKDVIDLLKEKISLLAEQNAALEKDNSTLKVKLYDLEQQLNQIKPKGELAEDTVKTLKLFFEQDGLTASHIAQALRISYGMADYHCGALYKTGMIHLPMIRNLGAEDAYYITQKGREYIVNHGHA